MIGASNISTNPVHCCGYSASGIGLTAHFYRDTDGENQIEAGALVLANNGVCCIDEFNFLSAQHRASIHEVMEHQKISLMKGKFYFIIFFKHFSNECNFFYKQHP